MKCIAHNTNRRGLTTVESAIILSTLLLLIFATFDLGLAAVRYNTLSYTARHLARQAIVRGAAAGPELTAWGPAKFDATAADASEIANTAAFLLPTMKASDVRIQVTWLDGDNQENNRVHIQINYTHVPLAPFLALTNSIQLQAECTMRIDH